ncbi:MAG: SDR family NAD(P)-dependent oxidoreductase [Pseudomonadota bacterium]
MTKPVCLVIGAGAGIGGTVGKKFAQEGYHACLCRRSDAAGLDKIVKSIESSGGEATGYMLNAVDDNAIEELVENIESNIGPIKTVIYNLGAQIGNRALAETSYKQFEMGWRLASFGLFRLAHSLFPKMLERDGGSLIVTSATAAVRGNAGQHSHAAGMGGRRMLCQTLNAEFAPKGIHVAHVLIDGAVDAPDTLGKMLGPEDFQALRESKGLENDGLILPEKLAETYFHIAHQHRSTWTHELDIRAHSDLAWWNHQATKKVLNDD